ncbi:MAG: AMP-binding protein [Bacteroidales bacterium]|nr:AMP-binding protein [Bacteroidales bacterium]
MTQEERLRDYKELDTVIKLFERSVSLYPTNILIKEKRGGAWVSETYSEVRAAARSFAAGLIDRGFEPGDRIALLSEGRRDWLVAELGMFYARVVNVPLSVKLEAEHEVPFRLQHSGARMLIVSKYQSVKLGEIFENYKGIENVIYFDEVPTGDVKGLSFKEICRRGEELLGDEEFAKRFEERVSQIAPTDLANISYTSGTTADPKGIMLTQRNYAANAMQSCTRITIPPTAVTLSILPWDHSFAHTVCLYCFIYYGAALAAQETGKTQIETLRNIPKNIKEIRPTLMMSVPALSKAFRRNIENGVREKGKIAWRLFNFFLRIAYKYNANWDGRGKGKLALLRPLMWLGDVLIFNKVKESFGGRLAHFIGGGALLDIELQRFFAAVGVPIMQGYGLSEASPVISTNALHAGRFGSSGKIVDFMELKICDKDGKEMPTGQTGEIVIKGDNVMAGYWRNEKATEETIVDGWLHTGDMGYVTEDRYLYVLGRFKSLLIGSDGEKYSPEGIEESIVELSEHIEQVMLYNNQSPYTVGFIVPSVTALKRTLASEGLRLDTPVGEARAIDIIAQELGEFRKGGAHAGMYPERWLPTAFGIMPEAMTEQNKMLNSTMKMVRNRVTERYKNLLSALYSPDMKTPHNDHNRRAIKEWAMRQ